MRLPTTSSCVCLVLVLAMAGLLPSTAAAAGMWGWSAGSRSWVASEQVLLRPTLDRGVASPVTRGEFLAALIRVQELRAERGALPAGAGRILPGTAVGAARSRALALGWFTPRAGTFAAAAPITADEAARATTAMLGLRSSVAQLATSLRLGLPGARNRWRDAAAQSIARTIGLRYNVPDPNDEIELGPREAVNVAHASYILAAASRASSWDLDEARNLARTMELPPLAMPQRMMLAAAVRQLGQPYVWAGESEHMQAEGHGGFDCSGFVIRVVNHGGLPAAAYTPIAERTSMTQSDIPRRMRISRDQLVPGDVMFFGERGQRGTPAESFHAALYMGNGWFIHSSGGNAGVAIDSLTGWWADRFAWGRRVLHTD